MLSRTVRGKGSWNNELNTLRSNEVILRFCKEETDLLQALTSNLAFFFPGFGIYCLWEELGHFSHKDDEFLSLKQAHWTDVLGKIWNFNSFCFIRHDLIIFYWGKDFGKAFDLHCPLKSGALFSPSPVAFISKWKSVLLKTMKWDEALDRVSSSLGQDD